MRPLEIGEAANGIPQSLRESEPTVPWSAIIGMRNWMAHRYFDTAHAYVWATVDPNGCSGMTTQSTMQRRQITLEIAA
jgi:uncharacterized protein with HEPN domain